MRFCAQAAAFVRWKLKIANHVDNVEGLYHLAELLMVAVLARLLTLLERDFDIRPNIHKKYRSAFKIGK